MSDLFPPTSNGRPRIAEQYDYRDRTGAVLFQVVRYEPKAFKQRKPDGNGGWIANVQGVAKVPYRLPELLTSPRKAPVFVVEGEKDADRLASLTLTATTNPGGAGNWRPEFSTHLKGKNVVILPDNDEPGREHARQVAASLSPVAASVKMVQLPGLPDKGDVSDWLDNGGTEAELRRLVKAAPKWKPDSNAKPRKVRDGAGPETHPGEVKGEPTEADDAPQQTQATGLVQSALDAGLQLFHDNGTAFVALPAGPVHPLQSRAVRLWLQKLAFDSNRVALTDAVLRTALTTLEAQAVHGADREPVFVRVAQGKDGAIWIDLCNEIGEAVCVTARGWRIERKPGVRFLRRSGQLPLPHPARGGKLSELQRSCNVTPRQWPLLLGFLTGCFRPSGPYPVLVLSGQQGASKSTLCRVLKSLVDPCKAPLRSLPRNEQDLMIAASGNWLLTLDNLSHLPVWLSDCVCRLVVKLLELEKVGGRWEGTATELERRLKNLAGPFPPTNFPKGPRALSGVLKRLTPNFHRVGIVVDQGRVGSAGTRTIRLRAESPRFAAVASGQAGSSRTAQEPHEAAANRRKTRSRRHLADATDAKPET